jgi:pimeloyl-ACP methyl ester carboxylesterase
MGQFQVQLWPTTSGDIAAYGQAPKDDGRPAVVILHGALRHSGVVANWAALLADDADVVLMDLPGHGRSFAGASDIPGMAQAIGQAIGAAMPNRRVLLVGESLGGTVALAVGGLADLGPVRAVFAADPPLTTAKLWNVQANFRTVMGKSAEETFVDRFGRDAFGILPEGLDERIYYPLIGALRVPAVIATGDVPLLPLRRTATVTCVFDAVDRFVVETVYPGKAVIEPIEGCGHLLMTQAPQALLPIVRRMLADIAAG